MSLLLASGVPPPTGQLGTFASNANGPQLVDIARVAGYAVFIAAAIASGVVATSYGSHGLHAQATYESNTTRRIFSAVVTPPAVVLTQIPTVVTVGQQVYTDPPSDIWGNQPPIQAKTPALIQVPQQAYVDPPSVVVKSSAVPPAILGVVPTITIVGQQVYTDAPSFITPAIEIPVGLGANYTRFGTHAENLYELNTTRSIFSAVVTPPAVVLTQIPTVVTVGQQAYTDPPSDIWGNQPPKQAKTPALVQGTQQAYTDSPSRVWGNQPPKQAKTPALIQVPQQAYTDPPSVVVKSQPAAIVLTQIPTVVTVGQQVYTDPPSDIWGNQPPKQGAVPARIQVVQQAYVDPPSFISAVSAALPVVSPFTLSTLVVGQQSYVDPPSFIKSSVKIPLTGNNIGANYTRFGTHAESMYEYNTTRAVYNLTSAPLPKSLVAVSIAAPQFYTDPPTSIWGVSLQRPGAVPKTISVAQQPYSDLQAIVFRSPAPQAKVPAWIQITQQGYVDPPSFISPAAAPVAGQTGPSYGRFGVSAENIYESNTTRKVWSPTVAVTQRSISQFVASPQESPYQIPAQVYIPSPKAPAFTVRQFVAAPQADPTQIAARSFPSPFVVPAKYQISQFAIPEQIYVNPPSFITPSAAQPAAVLGPSYGRFGVNAEAYYEANTSRFITPSISSNPGNIVWETYGEPQDDPTQIAAQYFRPLPSPVPITSVTVTGVSVGVQIGTVCVHTFSGINDTQTPNWTPVPDVGTPNWVPVIDTQTQAWTPVSNPQNPGWTAIDDTEIPGWTPVNDDC